MQAEFWLERWKQNQIGFHQREINSHLQAFWDRLGLPASSRVFVPLCGKSRDMLWLRAQGHAVLGVELSQIAVRDFYAENRLAARTIADGRFERWESDRLVVLRGDFFDLRSADLAGVMGVYDRASLIALPPDMRPRYVAHSAAIVPPAAETLLVTMEYPPRQMDGPPFSVTEGEVRMLYEDRYRVTPLFTLDILEENLQFRARGLTTLVERVYHLVPRALKLAQNGDDGAPG